jgi:hypothetical protein
VRRSSTRIYEYLGGRGLAAKILWDRLGRSGPTLTRQGGEHTHGLTGPLTAIHPGSGLHIGQIPAQQQDCRLLWHRVPGRAEIRWIAGS